MKLTPNEIKVLNAMRNNEYQDALQDGGTWTFTAVDNSGLTEKVARGVLSSLVKKGLVTVYGDYNSTDDTGSVNYTMQGKQLFDTADGIECPWGGAKLLKEVEEVKAPVGKNPKGRYNVGKEVEVVMYTFTGMKIQGTFKTAKAEDGTYTITTKKGQLTFDGFGKQVNAKNPKFANKIEFK